MTPVDDDAAPRRVHSTVQRSEHGKEDKPLLEGSLGVRVAPLVACQASDGSAYRRGANREGDSGCRAAW